jgi:hypothetical protein
MPIVVVVVGAIDHWSARRHNRTLHAASPEDDGEEEPGTRPQGIKVAVVQVFEIREEEARAAFELKGERSPVVVDPVVDVVYQKRIVNEPLVRPSTLGRLVYCWGVLLWWPNGGWW